MWYVWLCVDNCVWDFFSHCCVMLCVWLDVTPVIQKFQTKYENLQYAIICIYCLCILFIVLLLFSFFDVVMFHSFFVYWLLCIGCWMYDVLFIVCYCVLLCVVKYVKKQGVASHTHWMNVFNKWGVRDATGRSCCMQKKYKIQN